MPYRSKEAQLRDLLITSQPLSQHFLCSGSDSQLALLLSELLDVLNIRHSLDLAEIIRLTEQWRRTPNQERWEMADVDLSTEQSEKLFNKLTRLNMVSDIKPESDHFDYALLLGASTPSMERRLHCLIDLWQEGVRFNQLIFLVGQRRLDARIDRYDHLLSRKNHIGIKPIKSMTEADAARLMYQVLDMPNSMRACQNAFITAPDVFAGNRWRRANTRDTIEFWLRHSPAPGNTLVLSDQPHAQYQLEVVNQVLGSEFTMEVAAKEADKETRTILYLDALALWLHNLQKRAG